MSLRSATIQPTRGATPSRRSALSETVTARRGRCVASRCTTSTTTEMATIDFLGRTDVPQMGIGLAALGRPGYINLGHDGDLSSKSVEDMRAQCWKVLDAAHAAGVRYFDAARSYGRAEEFLSGWLEARGHSPDDVLVGSKWGYTYTADWRVDTGGEPHEVKEHSIGKLTEQIGLSSGLLSGHLNLYQIHSATFESGVLENAAVLEGLAALRADKGWKIGLSLSSAAQGDILEAAMAVRTASGEPLFDSVQATWNLLEQSAGPALLKAKQAGMSVIIKEGMANGRVLSTSNSGAAYADKLKVLDDMAAKYDTTSDALALAAIMAQPFAPMVLSGAATEEHLAANAAAMALAPRLAEDDVAALTEALAQEPEGYWAERSAMAWN